MPSLNRLVYLALKLIIMSASLSVAPSPRACAAASHSSSLAARPTSSLVPSHPSLRKPAHTSAATSVNRSIGPRKMKPSTNDDDDDYNMYYNQMKNHAEKCPSSLKELQYRQCTEELSGYHSSLLGIQELLRPAARGKGLANYDPDNGLETRDVLSATTVLSYNLPLLGPCLGPIMYEIKCIVENISDALLNALGLCILSDQTAKTSCLLGLGFC
ncbi:hypothetical protein DL96DRAFT_1575405 [Flagelloscypha sp. PMI_526]|nr:hypothetical protein DL96DRAFT_1575405 [Flagelloscypha sp. PMI_526]